MQQKRWFTKYFIPSILFLLGVLLGLASLNYFNSTFRFTAFDIQGGSETEKNNIISTLKHSKTFTASCDEISRNIHTRFPHLQVKTCTITYPNRLSLSIYKEAAFAYLKTDLGYITLSKNGIILAKERNTISPQPAITFFQTVPHTQYQVGEKITFSAIQRALYFLTLMDEVGYRVETVAIDSVDMIACKTKGFEVYFSQTRELRLQSNEVRQLVRQLKAGALKIVRLDLRFDKPVVQLPKK